MLTQPCLACQSLAVRWLETVSEEAQVNYYRCERCGHVWTLPKGQIDADPTPITTSHRTTTAPRSRPL
jgi:uncharacterized Zn finger protein